LPEHPLSPPFSCSNGQVLGTGRCCRRCACRTRRRTGQRGGKGDHTGRRALGIAQVEKPRGAVELGEDLTDVSTAVGVECVDALHLLIAVAGTTDRDPSPGDVATGIEDVKGVEDERGLTAAPGDEGCLVGKCDTTKWDTSQGIDRITCIVEGVTQKRVGVGYEVGGTRTGQQGVEAVHDTGRLISRQAFWICAGWSTRGGAGQGCGVAQVRACGS